MILFAGHSHLGSLGLKGDARDSSHVVPDPEYSEILYLKGPWPRPYPGPYWDAFVEHAAGKVAALIWGGNEHHNRFLIDETIPFDLFSSTMPELPLSGAMLVPEQAVETLLGETIRSGLAPLVRQLRRSSTRVIVCGTPACKGDGPAVVELFRRDLERLPNAALATSRMSPGVLQVKLWGVVQMALRRAAESNGGEFLPSPVVTQTPQHLLKREYWAEDVTHANVHYGDVLKQELLSYLNSPTC